MKLYHYTSVPLACGIFSSSLSYGHYSSQYNGIVDRVVWLTSSLKENEHGLLTGKKITNDRDLQYAEKIQGKTIKNSFTADKTKVRIEIFDSNLSKMDLGSYRDTDRTDWEGLVDYEKFSKYLLRENKLYRQIIGLSCFYDLETLSDSEMKKVAKKKLTNLPTWKLFFGDINPVFFESVKFKHKGNYVPFDFEFHGRKECAVVGIHYLPATALKSFSLICEPVNRYEIPMMAAFCSSLDEAPHLICRSGVNEWKIYLDDYLSCELLSGQIPSNLKDIKELVEEFKEEAVSMWHKAVQSYKEYYPK